MGIYEITGDDLQVFLSELVFEVADVRIVRIAVGEGQIMIKVDEYDWTRPLGARKEAWG